jgi:glucosamine--fructose-6-phosphate aminotransferase (isomerizing)
MFDAITDQPAAIRRVVERNHAAICALARMLVDARAVWLAGIGTSLNAAMYGEYWLRSVGGLRWVRAVSSFDLANYYLPLETGWALITVSHRGWKQFSARAVAAARERGVLTAAISGEGPSEGARLADYLFITTEQEKSGAHTKSLTTAMALLFDLAIEVRRLRYSSDEASQILRAGFVEIPARYERRIADHGREREAAAQFKNYKRIVILGAGPNYVTAREIALKLKEAAYSYAEALQVEEFLHGPIAACDAETLAILIAGGPGPSGERMVQAARAIGEVGAARIAIVAGGVPAPQAEFTIPVESASETLSPFTTLLSLQLFTYYSALARNADPDRMHRGDPHHARAAQHYEL